MARKHEIKCNEVIIINVEIKVTLCFFSLEMGNWTNQFEDEEVRVILAKTLNSVIHKLGRDVVVGYLITCKRLFLVLQIEKKHIDKFITVFHKKLKKEIKHFNHEGVINMNCSKLFILKKPDIINEYLIQLLTGRQPQIKYDDTKLDRQKKYIKNHPFCSAIDYSGAKGPVRIKLLEFISDSK